MATAAMIPRMPPTVMKTNRPVNKKASMYLSMPFRLREAGVVAGARAGILAA